MIDAALVGLGRWGRALHDAVEGSDSIRFVRGFDPSAGPLPGLAASRSFDEILHDKNIAAVVLATPHSLHREQVLAAARAGKHVFCEKPLALRLDDARAMVEACRAAQVTLAVGHNRRFWPGMAFLKNLLAEEKLGRLLHIEGHNSNENSNRVAGGWRTLESESPGGGFTGAGLHVLDVFTWLFGPVRRVRAAQLATYRAEIPPLDAMSALYEFENGCTGMLATVRATPFYWRVHVFGSEGSAEVLGETEVVLRMRGEKPRRVQLDAVDSVRAELDAFALAAENGPSYPISTAEMLATVAAFEATVAAL